MPFEISCGIILNILLNWIYHDKISYLGGRSSLLRVRNYDNRRWYSYNLHLELGDENFNKSFLRIIDNDDDGIITAKEMKDFTPCPGYDGKKLAREFKEYGRKADLN